MDIRCAVEPMVLPSLSAAGEMICPERERLAHEYHIYAERFRDAVLALKDLHGVQFDRVYEQSELHRAALEKARRALEKHQADHHC